MTEAAITYAQAAMRISDIYGVDLLIDAIQFAERKGYASVEEFYKLMVDYIIGLYS